MKKTSTIKSGQSEIAEMRSEYNFDYRQARPNRFAGRIDKNRLVVVLDPDIAEVFTTPESVNTVLRALINTMPKVRKPRMNHKSPTQTASQERA
jgi:hypothetical protein